MAHGLMVTAPCWSGWWNGHILKELRNNQKDYDLPMKNCNLPVNPEVKSYGRGGHEVLYCESVGVTWLWWSDMSELLTILKGDIHPVSNSINHYLALGFVWCVLFTGKGFVIAGSRVHDTWEATCTCVCVIDHQPVYIYIYDIIPPL